MSFPLFYDLEQSSIAPPELLVKLKLFSLIPEWEREGLPFVCPDCSKRISCYRDGTEQVCCLICEVNSTYCEDDPEGPTKESILLNSDQVSNELEFLKNPRLIEKVFDDWIRMH